MVAQVLPFFPEFRFAAEAIRENRYGTVQAAHFWRVISRPDWSAGIANVARSGGPAIDLHIHDTHYVGLVCGVPRVVFSRGVEAEGAVLYLSTQYLYDSPGPVVSAVSGALSQSGRPFSHGFEIYLDRATLAFGASTLGDEFHVATPLSVIRPDGSVERPELGSGDPIAGFTDELEVAVGSVRQGQAAPALSGELARQALRLCHAEIESVRTGKPVTLG
jgi:predicted dehydrogenase